MRLRGFHWRLIVIIVVNDHFRRRRGLARGIDFLRQIGYAPLRRSRALRHYFRVVADVLGRDWSFSRLSLQVFFRRRGRVIVAGRFRIGPRSRFWRSFYIARRHFFSIRLRTRALSIVLAMNIDDQPVGIGQQKRVVVRQIVDFQHNPRPSGLKLRHSDLLQESVINIEALSHQCRRELRIAQVEKDPVGIRQPLRSKLDLALQVDGHSRVVWCRPVPNRRHPRQVSRALFGCVRGRSVPVNVSVLGRRGWRVLTLVRAPV